MKYFYSLQAAVSIAVTLAVWVMVGKIEALAFFSGAIFSGINVLTLQYVWARVFGKKSVAWTVSIIVLKYTIFIAVLYLVAARNLLPLGWFGIGLGTLVISAVGFALNRAKEEK